MRMINGMAYLDRAPPRLAPAKFLVLGFMRGLLIEPAPGSNCPGRICWSGLSALASRFLIFCAPFAFARWRALALVMTSSPNEIPLWAFDDPLCQKRQIFLCLSDDQPPEGAFPLGWLYPQHGRWWPLRGPVTRPQGLLGVSMSSVRHKRT